MRRDANERMRVSMTLPTMVGGNSREQTMQWCRTIDDGPFHTLAIGERIAFDNPEAMTTLAFAAAVTTRVLLSPTIIVLPAHPEVVAAKQLATIDMLSEGRMVVGVGVGGREEEYQAFGRPFAKLHQRLDEQMLTMRSVWDGEVLDGFSRPVGPSPVGPMPILSGSLGPKSMARAAKWANGVNGFSLNPNTEDWGATFAGVRDAWAKAGNESEPYLATSFFYSAAGDSVVGGDEVRAYAREYLGIFGDELASMMADMTTAHSLALTIEALDRLEAAGVDEVYLVPTSSTIETISETAAALDARRSASQ